MFCSRCGTQLDISLNYCSRCGSRVAKTDNTSMANNLSQSMGYVGGFGLLGFIVVIAVLLKRAVPMEALVPIAFFYLAALVAISWLMLRYTAQPSRPHVDPPARGQSADELRTERLTTAQLDAGVPPEPASVTERTTRTLKHTPLRR